MKVLLLICIIASTVLGIQGAVSQMLNATNSKFPNADCWTEESGPMKARQMVTVEGCERYECLGSGHIETASCGLSVFVGDCSQLPTVEDVKDKPYPDCCIPTCRSD